VLNKVDIGYRRCSHRESS